MLLSRAQPRNGIGRGEHVGKGTIMPACPHFGHSLAPTVQEVRTGGSKHSDRSVDARFGWLISCAFCVRCCVGEPSR